MKNNRKKISEENDRKIQYERRARAWLCAGLCYR